MSGVTELARTAEVQTLTRLSALVAADGAPKVAARRLAADGHDVKWTELKELRETHAALYQTLAVEQQRAIEEAIVIEFRELARLSQKVTRNYLEDLVEKQATGELSHDERRSLPQVVQALSKVQQVSIDKVLAMTGRPTDGGATDPLENVRELISMGVLQPRERPLESTAVEVDG